MMSSSPDRDRTAPVSREQSPRGLGASQRIQSVDRAAALLNAVAAGTPDGRSVTDLARACDLNRATTWRLLATLEYHGLVGHDTATNTYAVGFAITRLAGAGGTQGLTRRLHPVLQWVSDQSGETANLAVPGRAGLTYIDEVVPPAVLAARWLGRDVPLHATSAGKALLAWSPEEDIAAAMEVPLPEFTATTQTSVATLRAELSDIRDSGFSVSVGELESGVYGVSVPVLNAGGVADAVVSVWGPRERVPESRFAELGDLLRRALGNN